MQSAVGAPTVYGRIGAYRQDAGIGCGGLGVDCGVRLHIGVRGTFKSSTSATVAQCAATCDSAGSSCGGFEFDTARKQCSFRATTACNRVAQSFKNCYTKAGHQLPPSVPKKAAPPPALTPAQERAGKLAKAAATKYTWKHCEQPVCVVDHDGECGLPWANRTATARCCSDVLFEYLSDVHQILKSLAPEHMIFFGSLLGAVRDHDVIPWETDGDIVVPAASYDKWKGWADAFASQGYIIFLDPYAPLLRACKAQTDAGKLPPKDFLPWMKGGWLPYIDIYRMTRVGSQLRVPADAAVPRSYRVSDTSPPSVCTIRGQPFPCPANPAAVLKQRYGNWQLPNPTHHKWKKDAQSTYTQRTA